MASDYLLVEAALAIYSRRTMTYGDDFTGLTLRDLPDDVASAVLENLDDFSEQYVKINADGGDRNYLTAFAAKYRPTNIHFVKHLDTFARSVSPAEESSIYVNHGPSLLEVFLRGITFNPDLLSTDHQTKMWMNPYFNGQRPIDIPALVRMTTRLKHPIQFVYVPLKPRGIDRLPELDASNPSAVVETLRQSSGSSAVGNFWLDDQNPLAEIVENLKQLISASWVKSVQSTRRDFSHFISLNIPLDMENDERERLHSHFESLVPAGEHAVGLGNVIHGTSHATVPRIRADLPNLKYSLTTDDGIFEIAVLQP